MGRLTDDQHARVIACAFRPMRDRLDLEAHLVWVAWLAAMGHRPEWLRQKIETFTCEVSHV